MNVKEPTNGSLATLKAKALNGSVLENFLIISSSVSGLVPVICPISNGLGK